MKKLACSLLTIIILFTISCEIGLGSSVDTDPPSLGIDPAIVDSVIADDFNIEGTYSDDGVISDINAILKRTDGTGKDIEIEGVLEEDPKKRGTGVWKIPVNSKTDKITDGSYQATVYIKDSMGRITTQSTTFTIDNTPPVLILTKPNSKPTDETVSAYGQRIFLEGSIADTAKETYIKVDFYKDADCTGDPLVSIKTDAIAPTDVNSNNARIAVFADSEDELKLYEKIYQSSTKEGSKDVYLKITASDIAGNETTDFYFSKDLAKNITKTKNKAADAYGLAPIDIYNILNGTDALKTTDRAAEDSDIENIKVLLRENTIHTAMISVNPENSPYFTVSGMKTLTKSGSDFESKENGYWVINGAQTLEISVFMGSDSIELVDDENFYVYVLECDNLGNPLKEDKEENRIKLYSKSKETGSGVNKKTYYSIGGKEGHKTTSGAYVFTVPMSKTIRPNPDETTQVTQNLDYKNYIIRVSGEDNEGNPIEPSEASGYGFHLSAGTGAPILNVEKPTDTTIFRKKGVGILFEGSAKSSEGLPTLTLWNDSNKDEEGNVVPVKIADIPLETGVEGELNRFSKEFTVEELGFPLTSKTYSLSIKASSGDQITEKSFSVWYDVEGPGITITSIQPVVNLNSKQNINGKLKINGTIIDKFDQFGSATFKAYQKKTANGDAEEVTAVTKEIESSFEHELDTTKLTDEKEVILEIKAYDRVGNETIWTKEYYVDQSTDKPTVTSSEDAKNIDKGIGTEGLAYVEDGNNLFIRGGNLVLSVADDDGVASARVIVQAYDKTKTGDQAVSTAASSQDKTYNKPAVISHTLPTEVGLYLATVTVKDTEFVSETETPNNITTKQFFLRVTGNGPDVSITPDREYIQTGSKYILTFDVIDEGNKPYKLKRNDDNISDEYNSINSDSFTYEYTPITGEKSIKFTVIDKNAGFTDKVFQPKFDDTDPDITISTVPDFAATAENTYLFKGTLSDLPSGVETVKIKFDDIANSKTTDWVNVESFSKSSWNYETFWSGSEATEVFKDVFTAENEKKVTVKAIDGAGNEKEASKIFVYDKKAPEVTIATSETTDGKEDISVSLTIKDSNPDKIEVKLTDSDGNVQDSITVTSFTGTSDIKFATTTIAKEKLTADGDYTINAKGIDKNGRESTVKSVVIKRDTSAPTVVIKSPVDDSKINEKALTETTQFTLRLDDANGTGVTKVFYKFTHDATPGTSGYTEDTTSNGPYTIDIPFVRADATDKEGKLEEGHWYLHVYAKDEAGNDSTPVTRKFDIDFSYPELTVTIPETTSIKYKTDGIYYFKGDLTGTISVSDSSGAVATTYAIDGGTATSLTVTESSTWTIASNNFTGSTKHTLTIEAKDLFNKITRKTFEIYRDEQVPQIEADNPEVVNTPSVIITGSANDADGVGTDKIQWSLTQNGIYYDIAGYSGGNTWNKYFTSTELGEGQGSKNLWFKAIDKLGNASTPNKIEFQYDNADPVITVDTINTYQTGTFILKGKAYDTNELVSVKLFEGNTEYDITPENSANAKSLSSAVEWTKTITVDTVNHTNDKSYKFTIKATDKANKETSITKEIVVDTKAPEVKLNGIPGRQDTKNKGYTFVGTADDDTNGSGVYAVTLTIIDAASIGQAEIVQKTVEVAGTTRWSYTLDCTDTEWQGVFANEGEKIIYVSATDVAGIPSTSFVYAKDAEGANPRSTENPLSFVYDTADPKLQNIIGFSDFMPSTGFSISGLASDSYNLGTLKVTEELEKIVTNNDGSKTITSSSDEATIAVSGKSTNWTRTLPIGGVPTEDAEYNYTYQFVLTDAVGNTVYSNEYKATLDKTNPTISITTPVNGAKKGTQAISETSFKFEGTVDETNLDAIYYAITTNATAPAKPTGIDVLDSTKWTGYTTAIAGTTSWNFYQAFKEKNSSETGKLPEALNYYVYVYAVDKAGNVSSLVSSNFDVDLSAPDSSVSVPQNTYCSDDLNSTSKKGSFNVTGTASDTMGLASVKVLAKNTKDNTKSKELSLTVSNGKVGTNGNWTQSFVFGSGENANAENYLAEGSYEITVTAKDIAEKETTSSPSAHVTIDYTAPNFDGTLQVNNTDYKSTKWYKTQTLLISIGASDGTTGTGISMVEAITKPEDAAASWSAATDTGNWTPLSLGNNGYRGTVQINGEDKIYLRVSDIAGNSSEIEAYSFNIDTSTPELELSKYKIGTTGDLKTSTGTVYINGSAKLTLYGTYSAPKSGVASTGLIFEKTVKESGNDVVTPITPTSLKFSTAESIPTNKTIADLTYSDYAADDAKTIRYWMAEFSNSSLGTGKISVKGANTAGTIKTTDLFTLAKDTVPPTFRKEKIEPNDEKFSVYKTEEGEEGNKVTVYYLNNKEQTFSISGLPSDADTSVDKVFIEIKNVDASGEVITTSTTIMDNNATGYFSGIEFKEEDGTVWTGGAKVTITTTDIAGNSTVDNNTQTVLNIKFDTQGPNGVHLLDGSSGGGKDLYFRVGDQNRDDFVMKDAVGDVILNKGNGTAIEDYTVDKDGDGIADIKYTYTSVPLWDPGSDTTPSLDKDVGGKYSGNTYGKAETIKLRGKFEDKVSDADDTVDGSGVNLIYYKIYKPTDTEVTKTTDPDTNEEIVNVDTSNFLKNYESIADGYFSTRTPETRRIFYTDTDGTLNETIKPGDFGIVTETVTELGDDPKITTNKKYYTNITTNYKTTIANLTEGENYLVLVAVDNVGNPALEGVEFNGHTFDNYRINVDIKEPEISSDNSNWYTRSDMDKKVTGTVTDKPEDNYSGIQSVWLKYDDDKNTWIKATVKDDNTWEAIIPADTITTTTSFTVTATDKSGTGNVNSCNFTLIIDDTPPTVTVSGTKNNRPLADQADVNGQITIKGISTDTYINEDEKTKLWYREKLDSDTTKPTVTSSSGWTPISAEPDDNGEWILDTTGENSPFTDGKVYYFTVEAEDKAGNKGYASPLELNVSKDSDRPIVKFYMSFGTGDITSDKTGIDGEISDDDGVPTDVKYCITNKDEAPANDNAWKLPEAANAQTKYFTYNSTTGAFTLYPGDGTKYIWFKITDIGGETFVSKTIASGQTELNYDFNTPKISDQNGHRILGEKTASKKWTTTQVPRLILATDTTPPLTDSFEYLMKGYNEAQEATATNPDGWSSNTAAATFGGTKTNTFRVKIYAFDEMGINSVTFKVPRNEGDPAEQKRRAVQDTSDSKWYYEYSLTENTSDTKLVKEGKEDYYTLWYLPDANKVDVTGFASGSRQCVVDTSDGTKHTRDTIVFTIDNDAPVVTFTGPTSDDSVTETVTLYGSVDSKATLSYAVSTSGTVKPSTNTEVKKWTNKAGDDKEIANLVGNGMYTYNPIDDATLSWFVYFDDLAGPVTGSDTGTHSQPLNNYLIGYGITNSDELSSTEDDQFADIVKLYIWIRAEDERGNISETPKEILLDPQGDRPDVKFSLPNKDGDSFGGPVQISGSASDPAGTEIGIDYVWVQIISRQHDEGSRTYTDANSGSFTVTDNKITSFTLDKKDLDYLRAKGYHIYNRKTYGKANGSAEYSGSIAEDYSASDYGIKIDYNGSWSLNLNANGEFDYDPDPTQIDPESTEEIVNHVAVRVISQDKDGKFSVEKDRYMIFDAQSPSIGKPQALYLIQSDSDAITIDENSKPDFGITASKEYREDTDVFVRGEWYLIGSVNDNDSIKKLTIDGITVAEYADKSTLDEPEIANGIKEGSTATWYTWTSTDKKTVYFKYKLLTSTGVGERSFDINVEDQASPKSGTNSKTVKVKYDNTAPGLTGADEAAYKISPSVVQKNSFYRIESKVTEDAVLVDNATKAQSGLDFVAFYFMRRDTSKTNEVDKIYNPLLARSSENSTQVSASTKTIAEANSLADGAIVYDSGLYWIKKTITVDSTLKNQLNVSSAENDKYIRKNGLVQINGAFYKTTDKTTTTVTLNGNPLSTETTAYFALAMLADNTSTEKGSENLDSTTGYPVTITGDDKDGFIDSIEKSGSTAYIWSAEIVSKNIPDGPIELHYVAFDKAGNYSIGIMGNALENDFRTSESLALTPDRKEYQDWATPANRKGNTLYVDGIKSYYNVEPKSDTETVAKVSVDIKEEEYKKAAFIENNAPRFASVSIWTDYNGNNSPDSGETYVKYNEEKDVIVGSDITKRAGKVTSKFIVSDNGHDYNSQVTGTAFVTIRDKTVITPEIVGGNGNLNYKRRIGKADNLDNAAYSGLSTDWNTDSKIQVEKSDYMDSTESYVDPEKTRHSDLEVTPNDLTALQENSTYENPYWFEYVIYDSTEGTTAGNSLSATMRVAMDVQYFDEVAPNAVISPFFWNSASNNSLYLNNKENGHIELEKDLSSTVKTLYGDDPKVSGKITIRGTAYDNIRLSQLWIKFDDISIETNLTGTNLDTTNHKDYILAAEYKKNETTNKMEWVSANKTMDNDNWQFSATDKYCNKDGHLVSWEFSINTANVKNGDTVVVAALNKSARVMAVDERGTGDKKYSGITPSDDIPTDVDYSTAAISYNVPYYQMDIVPYITGITTPDRQKSGLKDNNIRAASGKYSVIKGNTSNFIEVRGFNLNPGEHDVHIVNTSDATGSGVTASTGEEVTLSTAASDEYTLFKLSNALSKSGYLEVFTNGVRVLNNINSNDSYGSYSLTGKEKVKDDQGNETETGNVIATTTDYANAYNREPDYYTTKNVQLTDDRYIRVFDMKDTGIKNGYYPVMVMSKETGRTDNPVFGYVDLKGGSVNTTTTSPYYGAGTDAGGHFPSYAMPQRAEFSADDGAPVYVEYLNKGSTWDQMGMAVDEGGRYYHVSVYNRDQCNMDFIYDRYSELYSGYTTNYNTRYYNLGWGTGVTISTNNYNYNTTMAYNANNNAITLESMNYNELAIGRYQYPKLITLGNSKTSKAQIYMMYYDDGIIYNNNPNKTGGLILRDFQIGLQGNVQGSTKNQLYSGSVKDNQNTAYNQYYNFNENTGRNNNTYTNTYRHVIAENATNHFSFDVTSEGVIVFVYYDLGTGHLVLKYSSTDTNSGIAQAVTGANPETAPKWTTTSIPFPDNVGTYVSLALDDNSVHIAAFDSFDSNLVYMYLPNFNSAEGYREVTVDQASAVGNWTQVKVRDGVPYIAYYNSTENGGRDGIKLAYPVATNGKTAVQNKENPGVDVKPGKAYSASDETKAATGYTTGAWEYMTVPALTSPQGGDPKFQNVCLDFDSSGTPVVGYLGTNLEFGKQLGE